MNNQQLIPIDIICTNLHIETSFIGSLQEYGLVEITTVNQVSFVAPEEVANIEQLARFRYEMDINLEGIEAISHILQKVRSMQNEITSLKNRLRFYDESH